MAFQDSDTSSTDVQSTWSSLRGPFTDAEAQTVRFKGVSRRLQTVPIAEVDMKSSLFGKLPDVKRGDELGYADGGVISLCSFPLREL
jgi:hypothetical protein